MYTLRETVLSLTQVIVGVGPSIRYFPFGLWIFPFFYKSPLDQKESDATITYMYMETSFSESLVYIHAAIPGCTLFQDHNVGIGTIMH